MTSLEKIEALADVSFINNMTLDETRDMLLASFQEEYKAITGEELILARSDPWYVMIQAQSIMNYQMLLFIDRAAKMNLLKYSTGDYLDHMGAMKNCPRKEAEPARVRVLFSMEAVRESAEVIPAGTSVTADNEIFFETVETVQIPAGELSTEADCVCTVPGIVGNRYSVGEISTLATPTGFIAAVTNTIKPYGGADRETDEEYKVSIYEAPDRLIKSGIEAAWVARVKDFNEEIEDVKVYSVTSSGIIQIYILMREGRFPSEAECEALREHLLKPANKEVGVDVMVKPPSAVEYDLNLTYYVSASGKERASEICAAAESAIDEYILWQGTAFDRDINPDELVFRIRQAGAKRAVITSPAFHEVGFDQVARIREKNITFGGIEND